MSFFLLLLLELLLFFELRVLFDEDFVFLLVDLLDDFEDEECVVVVRASEASLALLRLPRLRAATLRLSSLLSTSTM